MTNYDEMVQAASTAYWSRRGGSTGDLMRAVLEAAGVPELLARLADSEAALEEERDRASEVAGKVISWRAQAKRSEAENARLREADVIVRDLATEEDVTDRWGICIFCYTQSSHSEDCITRRARVYVEREEANRVTVRVPRDDGTVDLYTVRREREAAREATE